MFCAMTCYIEMVLFCVKSVYVMIVVHIVTKRRSDVDTHCWRWNSAWWPSCHSQSCTEVPRCHAFHRLQSAAHVSYFILIFSLSCLLNTRWCSDLTVTALDYHVWNHWFESRFMFVMSGSPPVHPAVMGTCMAGSLRHPGVVLTTSPHCVLWLLKPVCPDSHQPHGPLWSRVEHWPLSNGRTALPAEFFCPTGFLCGRPVSLELIARVPERPRRRQRQFQKTVEAVSVCSILMHTAHQRFHDDALYKFTLHYITSVASYQ